MLHIINHMRRKEERAINREHDKHSIDENLYVSDVCPNRPMDNKMARLLELFGYAIDVWKKEFHLENLPKEIVFEQVFDVMQILESAIKHKD